MIFSRPRITALGSLVLFLAACSAATSADSEPFKSDASAVIGDPPCRPPTAAQTERIELAVQVLRTYPRHASIYRGAMDVIGYARDLGDDAPFCIDDAVKDRVVDATLAAEAWSHGLAGLSRLRLARQPDGPIARDREKPLVELAYAFGAAGEAARPHVPLLLAFLDREVESAAPPFGIIQRTPDEVCHALERISGNEAERALQEPRCAERHWSTMPG